MLEFVDTAAQAVSRITDGATVLIGGFGNAGQPMELIDALPKGEPPANPGKIVTMRSAA